MLLFLHLTIFFFIGRKQAMVPELCFVNLNLCGFFVCSRDFAVSEA